MVDGGWIEKTAMKLKELEAAFDSAVLRIEIGKQSSYQGMIDAGRNLIAIRAELSGDQRSSHGKWLSWLEARRVPERSARNWMALYETGLTSKQVLAAGGLIATLSLHKTETDRSSVSDLSPENGVPAEEPGNVDESSVDPSVPTESEQPAPQPEPTVSTQAEPLPPTRQEREATQRDARDAAMDELVERNEELEREVKFLRSEIAPDGTRQAMYNGLQARISTYKSSVYEWQMRAEEWRKEAAKIKWWRDRVTALEERLAQAGIEA